MSSSKDNQAARPSGIVGWIFGEIMAWSNHEMNLFTLESLQPTATDRVLEIGFGPGRMLAALADRVQHVDGVDLSSTMVSQASWRNAAAIAAGRVRVQEASIERLPFADACFDAVCAVNTFQFWPQPEENLREVRRVVRCGGRVAITLRSGAGSWPLGFGGLDESQTIATLQSLLPLSGFCDVRPTSAKLRLVTATCITAAAD